MSYLEPKIRYMNSVSGSSAGNLPDAEEAYWSYLEDNGQPAGEVTSADISDASEVGVAVLTAEDAAAARTELGLGALATAATIANAQVASGAAIALNKLANVAAGTDGLAAGTIQATLQALATRIQALEDAAAE